jgi:glutaconate CoA-transferase subunit A
MSMKPMLSQWLMNSALASAEGTAGYVRDFVEHYDGIDGYLDMIGRDKVADLGKTETAFLLDPYRKWILNPDEVARLQGAGGPP